MSKRKSTDKKILPRKQPFYSFGRTKRLYVDIAKHFGTTPTRVERAIRQIEGRAGSFLPFTIYPFISETHSENTSPAFFPVFAEHTSSYLYFASYFPDVTS